MNKKILVFIVLAIAALSIMAISIWGTLAESQTPPSVSGLEITGYDQVNDFGDKIIFVKDLITESDYMFRIDYQVTPGDADQSGIKAKLDVDRGVQVITSVEDLYVMVVFDTDRIGQSVTVTIWDAKSMTTDSVTLLFANENEVDINDPGIFD